MEGSVRPEDSEGPRSAPTPSGGGGARFGASFWLAAGPLFLSALLFLSGLFSVFAPLPVLFQYFRSGRRRAWLSILTNSALVFLFGGVGSLAIYGVLVGVLCVCLGEFLGRAIRVERAAVYTLLVMGVVAGGLVGVEALLHHGNPAHELKEQVSTIVDFLGQNQNAGHPLPDAEREEWKRNVWQEFPSAIGIFALLLVWSNLLVLLRANPGGLRERLGIEPTFFRRWKAPEFLVWPAIVSGFLILLDQGVLSVVALNVFKFLMAIYAIQGLSILVFFFDLWKVRGLPRTLGFLVSILLMMPLLLSLGFFDLWFDFRSKFRQS